MSVFDPLDFDGTVGALMAIQARQEAHRASCSVRPCRMCGWATCPRCKVADVPYGGKPEPCEACRVELERAALLAPALATIPPRFAWARFGPGSLVSPARPDGTVRTWGVDIVGRCRHAMKARGALLVGPPGAGKTALACAMLRTLIEDSPHPRTVATSRLVTAFDLQRARKGWPLGEGEPPLVREALAAHVLVLDDLGQEEGSGPGTAVTDVLQARHNEERPTWITTWMVGRDLAQRYGGGITRRVVEDAKADGAILMLRTEGAT